MLYRDENEFYAYTEMRDELDERISEYDDLTDWLTENAERYLELDDEYFDTGVESPELMKLWKSLNEVFDDFIRGADYCIEEAHLSKERNNIIDEYLKGICGGHPEWSKILENIW